MINLKLPKIKYGYDSSNHEKVKEILAQHKQNGRDAVYQVELEGHELNEPAIEVKDVFDGEKFDDKLKVALDVAQSMYLGIQVLHDDKIVKLSADEIRQACIEDRRFPNVQLGRMEIMEKANERLAKFKI